MAKKSSFIGKNSSFKVKNRVLSYLVISSFLQNAQKKPAIQIEGVLFKWKWPTLHQALIWMKMSHLNRTLYSNWKFDVIFDILISIDWNCYCNFYTSSGDPDRGSPSPWPPPLLGGWDDLPHLRLSRHGGRGNGRGRRPRIHRQIRPRHRGGQNVMGILASRPFAPWQWREAQSGLVTNSSLFSLLFVN